MVDHCGLCGTEGRVQIGVEGFLDRLRIQCSRLSPEVGSVDEPGQELARVRPLKRPVAVESDQESGRGGIRTQSMRLALAAEDAGVHLGGRVWDQDLVRDPAQERLVHELGRLQVGREDHLAGEGNFDLVPAGGEVHEVDAFLHGHDEAVEQAAGRFGLAAEVVDHE